MADNFDHSFNEEYKNHFPTFTPMPASHSGDAKKRNRAPFGIYVFSAIFFVLGLIDLVFISEDGFYLVHGFLCLALAVGLLLRRNLARIVIIVLAWVAIVFSTFVVAFTVYMLATVEANYATQRTELEQRATTNADRNELRRMESAVAKARTNELPKVASSLLGVVIPAVLAVGVIRYLGRASVRLSFH